jgi:hypothetical protein
MGTAAVCLALAAGSYLPVATARRQARADRSYCVLAPKKLALLVEGVQG